MTFKEAQRIWELEFWQEALATYGTVQKTALAVGVDRTHVYKRLARVGIKRRKHVGNWGNLSNVEPRLGK
jgi:DNA-binding NtrC family response regulator